MADRRIGGQLFKPETFTSPVQGIKYIRVTLTEVISGGVVDKIGISEWILYGE